MNTLRKIAAAVMVLGALTTTAHAQDKKMDMKEHQCTSACKDGKHMYAHGEKGHVCTKACKKMEKKNKM